MYNHRATGRLNHDQGELLEKYISNACDYYLKNGIANIEKTPEPMRVIKPLDSSHTMFAAVFEKKAQADYKGVLKGGRCIHFEAKSTRCDEIKQSAVTNDQTENLDSTYALGGECFVVVALIKEGKYYRVPWDVWKRMKELFGHKYMNVKELEPYQIKFCLFGIDFLKIGYSGTQNEVSGDDFVVFSEEENRGTA